MLSPSEVSTMMSTTTNTVDTRANPTTVQPPPDVREVPPFMSGSEWFEREGDEEGFMNTLDNARKVS